MKNDRVISLDKPVSADVSTKMPNEWYLGVDYLGNIVTEGNINGRFRHRKGLSRSLLKSSNKPGEMVIGISKL